VRQTHGKRLKEGFDLDEKGRKPSLKSLKREKIEFHGWVLK
jgi:hypothetical protein